MVISHKYKYLFIQLDKTASTAIAKELVENYGGQPTLWKHARYEDFMKVASPEEKKYFIFSGIRNPLDVVVSYYHYFKNGGNREYTLNNKKYIYIKEKNATFVEYFKRFHANEIYREWKMKNFDKLNYIYRYENIEEDFAAALKMLKIAQKRGLPIFNRTEGKRENYELYYTPEIQGMAKIVFNEFMKEWDYKFPENWRGPNFKEKYILRPTLYLKLFLKKIAHSIIDSPAIYKKFYGFKTTKKDSHIS